MQSQERRGLDKEAEAHIALGVLLRKKRSPEKREQVRQLLQSNLSTSRLVSEIRRLDSGPTDHASPQDEETEVQLGEESAASPEQEPAPPPVEITVGRGPMPFRFTIPKLKSILKLPLLRTPFFRYLFVELPKIVDFGRVSHVFSPPFLIPLIRLDESVRPLLHEWIQSWSTELLSYLKPVLQVGWRHLSKREYNMIVALERLCREIGTVNFQLLNLRDRGLLDKMRALETLFLALHYAPETVDELLAAVGEVMRSEHDLIDRAERAELLVFRLLVKDFTIPSLYNVILGLNMMKLRRAFTMQELLSPDLGDLFDSSSFACDHEVQTSIDKFMEEASSRLLRLRTEWSRARRVVGMLRVGEDRNPDYSLLRELYEFSPGMRTGRSFAEDRENVMVLAPMLLRRFDAEFAALLGGKIGVRGIGKREIFTEHFFRSEFDRIRLSISKIERHAIGFRSFPYARYAAIRREGTGAVSTEIEVIGYLQEALQALVSVGRRIDELLALSSSRRDDSSRPERAARMPRPVDPSVLQLTRPFELPFASDQIGEEGYLRGKTLSDALQIAAAACFQTAMYLHDHSMVDTVAAEVRLSSQIESQMEVVRRIGDSRAYDELRSGLPHAE